MAISKEVSNDKSPKKKSLIKEFFGIAAFAAAGAVGMLAFTQFFGFYSVSGQSMENTYFEGDKLIIEKNRNDSYERGEVVILSCSEEGKVDTVLIKRVIAVGGDTLDIDFETGTVTVNGEVLDEPYIKELTHKDDGGFEYPVTVPEGCYFCMGDNRNNSSDSRDERVGFVPESDIQGRVKIKLPSWL